jgi:hypothetical protein
MTGGVPTSQLPTARVGVSSQGGDIIAPIAAWALNPVEPHWAGNVAKAAPTSQTANQATLSTRPDNACSCAALAGVAGFRDHAAMVSTV